MQLLTLYSLICLKFLGVASITLMVNEPSQSESQIF